MLVPTPTIQLEARAHTTSSSSASQTSSDYCSNKAHSKSAACQKPVNQNGLEIGLGVGIPVFLIMCVLGYFLFRNYRKDKREGLEHDPDFDEIGEATALPDFPAPGSEDPFAGPTQRRYTEYPDSRLQNPSTNDLSKFSTRNLDEGFDAFVLPYQHQTGSKASLDEYAKQIMDKSTFGKSMSVHPVVNPLPGAPHRFSPQKSRMSQLGQTAPVGKLQNEDFTRLTNDSATLVDDEFYNSRDHFGPSEASLVNSNRFDVQYENEEPTDIESAAETETEDTEEYHNTDNNYNNHAEQTDDIESVEDFSDSDEQPGVVRAVAVDDLLSPFEDENEVSPKRSDSTRDTSASIGSKTELPQKISLLKKSPALATLDVLKSKELENEEQNDKLEEVMTKEQEEQLARMKSVYNVYFDRSNSVKSEAPESKSFHADESQPLPQLDPARLKVNENLNADTDYSKRHTTASSVYDAVPIFHNEDQPSHGYPQANGYSGEYESGYQHGPYAEANNSQTDPPQPLPPLQSLPHPSDFRNSSIETFTNYVPRPRLVSGSKHDNESALSSPVTRHQHTFGTPVEEGLPPSLRKTTGDAVPSPTQLSRTSVVMLNHVSEIAPLRPYRPAGYLPSGAGSPSMTNNEWASSHDDLIPGNRKSAVRRMMNSNF